MNKRQVCMVLPFQYCHCHSIQVVHLHLVCGEVSVFSLLCFFDPNAHVLSEALIGFAHSLFDLDPGVVLFGSVVMGVAVGVPFAHAE